MAVPAMAGGREGPFGPPGRAVWRPNTGDFAMQDAPFGKWLWPRPIGIEVDVANNFYINAGFRGLWWHSRRTIINKYYKCEDGQI